MSSAGSADNLDYDWDRDDAPKRRPRPLPQLERCAPKRTDPIHSTRQLFVVAMTVVCGFIVALAAIASFSRNRTSANAPDLPQMGRPGAPLKARSNATGGPCDIYGAASPPTPCVAAHSTVRALYHSYDGPLYRVKSAEGATQGTDPGSRVTRVPG